MDELKKYLKIKRNRNLYEKVKKEFKAKGPIAHNWDHIHRDTINAIWIGEAEAADMEIVFPAILLHDVGFLYDSDPSIHHTLGAEKCIEWLEDWIEIEKEKVSQCVLKHKGKGMGFENEPETIEEKVVHDADQLEKVGWSGVMGNVRAMVEFAESTMPKLKSLKEMAELLSSFKDIKFYTKTAMEMAKKRGGFKKEVFERALEELDDYK